MPHMRKGLVGIGFGRVLGLGLPKVAAAGGLLISAISKAACGCSQPQRQSRLHHGLAQYHSAFPHKLSD